MTIFGKVLLGLILATAAVLIIKGAGKPDEEVAVVPAEETPTPAPATPTSDEEVVAFNGSAKELMARGGDHKCTFTQEVENSKSTGTVYVSGKKLRGDFSSDVSAGGASMTVDSHMISDGEFMWTWSSAMPTGFKMKVDQEATASANNQGFDSDQKLEYTCIKWTPEESQFVLPSAVVFTELKS